MRDQKRKKLAELLLIVKGTLREERRLGEATLQCLKSKLEGEQKLSETFTSILMKVGARQIALRLRESVVEESLVGSWRLAEYERILGKDHKTGEGGLLGFGTTET